MTTEFVFKLSPTQIEKYQIWSEEHECSLPCVPGLGKHCGAIGGEETFCFTPTGIGTFLNVKCVCGASLDLSEI